MKPEIKELIEISKYYGSNKDFVIAGEETHHSKMMRQFG
jgi:hypothetical protein